MEGTSAGPGPGLPSAGAGLARLEAANAWLRELLAVKDAELAAARQQIVALGERVAELERRLGRDSSTSSRPPSSDSPFARKPRDRSLRGRSGRRPGKQPGARSAALRLSPRPDLTVVCAPEACSGCGAGLAGAPVAGVQRRQVVEVAPAPPPVVTEYQVQARACRACGAVTAGAAPEGVTGRVQYGPRAHAVVAALACGHHVPIARAARLAGELAGLSVSAGWAAGVRRKAAARLGPFTDHVRGLLRQAGVLYADETPARAAGGLRYVHAACTPHLTALHTGDRSAAAIDAGRVLPGYAGTIMRDGYSGYGHLTSAAHAWCGAHSLRDLRDLYTADPHGQAWARAMADVLLAANAAAGAARAAGLPGLTPAQLAGIRAGYQLAVDSGIHDNTARGAKLCRDGVRLARRFAASQDMILRFTTDLAVGFTNNQAERDIRPVKVAQRTAGGCWRTLDGLADFAVVQSYLSTAAKWGITTLDALTQLFTTGPWLPPATAPP